MILVPISIGELVDKISILKIKSERVQDSDKLINIQKELKELLNFNFDYKHVELKKINEELWDVEDNIRKKESKNEFDNEFIELARSVYLLNDKRSLIKKEINLFYKSDLIEEKSY
jgi:hypothetical protein